MATQGSPLAGRTELARRCYVLGDDCSLVCYTNTAGSLGDATLAADLVQPPLANGYSPIALAKTNWTVAGGIATYYDPAGMAGDPTWSASGAWGADPVNGVAMIYGTVVLHFRDLSLAFFAAANKKLSESISNLLM